MRRLLVTLVLCFAANAAYAQGGAPSSGADQPSTPSSQTQTSNVEEILRGFGLTGGPWSADCSRPEGPSNWYGYFEVRDGRVTQVYSNGSKNQDGSKRENRYEILDATKLTNERLRVRVRFTNSSNDDLQTLEWVVRGNRLRTFSNISDRRGQIVKDGRAGDDETPWVSRCK